VKGDNLSTGWRRAREAVRRERGATGRRIELILRTLNQMVHHGGTEGTEKKNIATDER